MIWQAWVFLGAVGLVAVYETLRSVADDAAILWGLIGLVTWGLFAFQSLNVVVVTDPTDPISYAYAPLAVLAGTLAVACLYVVITGPIAMIDQPRTKEQLQ